MKIGLRIGFRTLKTAVGVSLSILISQSLQLENYPAAGILTLLCIQKSRKQSMETVISRFAACMMGMLFSSALFSAIGYHFYTFIVLLLFFIPLCVKFRIQEGIASSSVIIMHGYIHGKVEALFFLNEFFLILIGLGVALVVNWYMPNIDKELTQYKEKADQLITTILYEIAAYLKEGYTRWDGSELLQLSEVLKKAKQLAQIDTENNPIRKKNSYSHYFEIKCKQYEILERMLPSISQITVQMEQSSRIADFVMELTHHLTSSNHPNSLNMRLKTIRDYHKELPLPETRKEFENRASLYSVANELERFINTM
jgi:uncharacterized membrane protein YgaE (UPF0421/DUF939 family)